MPQNLMAVLLRAIKLCNTAQTKNDLKEAKRKVADDAKASAKALKKKICEDKAKAADEAKIHAKALKMSSKLAKAKVAFEEKANKRKIAGEVKDSAKKMKFDNFNNVVEMKIPSFVRVNPFYETSIPCSIKVEPEPVSMYIDKLWVESIVSTISSGTDEEYIHFHEFMQNEYGQLFETGMIGNHMYGMKDSVVKKLFYIDKIFMKLSSTPCQDSRCTVKELNIIEPDLFMDEINGNVPYIMRRGRGFAVHDTLSFNCVMREIQRAHPTFPRVGVIPARGTKAITDALYLVGLGPPKEAHAHNSSHYRGPRSTDPDKTNPNGPIPGVVGTLPSERDGLYYRRYEYSDGRMYKDVQRDRHFKGTSRSNSSAVTLGEEEKSNTTVSTVAPIESSMALVESRRGQRSLLELYEMELSDRDY